MIIPLEERVYINEVHFRLRKNLAHYGGWDYVVAYENAPGKFTRLSLENAATRFHEYMFTCQ